MKINKKKIIDEKDHLPIALTIRNDRHSLRFSGWRGNGRVSTPTFPFAASPRMVK